MINNSVRRAKRIGKQVCKDNKRLPRLECSRSKYSRVLAPSLQVIKLVRIRPVVSRCSAMQRVSSLGMLAD